MKQLDLFAIRPAKRPRRLPTNGTDTSAVAAERARHRAPSIGQRIFEYLAAIADGATDEELQDSLDISGDSIRPARGRLVELGLILDSRARRPTRSGTPAIVWKVTGRPWPV